MALSQQDVEPGDRWRCLGKVLLSPWVCWFSITALTSYHKLSVFKKLAIEGREGEGQAGHTGGLERGQEQCRAQGRPVHPAQKRGASNTPVLPLTLQKPDTSSPA